MTVNISSTSFRFTDCLSHDFAGKGMINILVRSSTKVIFPILGLPIYTLKFARHQSGCIGNNSNFQHAVKFRGSTCVTVAKCCEIWQFFSSQNISRLLFWFSCVPNCNVWIVKNASPYQILYQSVKRFRRYNSLMVFMMAAI